MVTDDALLAGLADDVAQGFEPLVLAYQDRLFAFSLRLSGSAQDAEEIAQDALVRAYRALEGYDQERLAALRLRPWLFQIALNVFRNRLRTKHVREVEPEWEGCERRGEPAADSRDQPERRVLRSELRAELASALRLLPERYRSAVVLRHVMALDYQELADVLRQPVGTAKSDVHRGVQLLRKTLEKEKDE